MCHDISLTRGFFCLKKIKKRLKKLKNHKNDM